MELTGDVLIGAPRATVWAGLNDTEVLTRCIPGCEAMEAVSPHERTARVAVKVGPVRARFAGRVRMSEIRPEQGCVLHFEGSGGAAGMAKGQSSLELLEEAGGTRLRYTAQASVGGKLGQVGGRMIDAAAKQMADQFFQSLTTQLAPPAAGASAQPPQPTPGDGDAANVVPAPASAVPAAALAAAALPSAPIAAPLLPPASGASQPALWFTLGSVSTGFGVWLGWLLFA